MRQRSLVRANRKIAAAYHQYDTKGDVAIQLWVEVASKSNQI
jgi:hypothetical protein